MDALFNEFVNATWDAKEVMSGPRLTIALGDVLSGKADIPCKYRLYVVRDRDDVFYVGQTGVGIVGRLDGHMGNGPSRRLSRLGEYITARLPQAKKWVVDCYTLADFVLWDVNYAEKELIDSLKPSLNIALTARNRTESTASDFIPFEWSE